MASRISAPEYTVAGRRILLFSLHNLFPAAWNGVFYEFTEVLRQMENATLVAPGPAGQRWSVWQDYRKVSQRLLSRLHRPAAAAAPPTRVEGEFDLAFYACQFPHEIAEIHCIDGWRERSKKACIFILETWAHNVEEKKAHYRHLDAFDHVFVFNSASAPLIQRYTSAPVTYLATAADALLLPESYYARERTVDYLCIGRRHNPVHASMFDHCCRTDRFYVFDLWKDMRVKEWPAARRQNADMGSRSKHYVVWPPIRKLPDGRSETALTTRYFEGASTGAVMIGAPPQVPEFERLFSAPEPVVDMPEDPELVPAFLDRLDADATYLSEVARMNRLDILERHDWAHRWAHILGVMGMPVSDGLAARLSELHRRRLTEAGARPHLVHPAPHPATDSRTAHGGRPSHA